MGIKSYRAATIKEALEQVKQELGEEALVIETKRVKSGGLLGVGAKDMIEVRVASNSEKGPNIQNKAVNKLSITDDSPAVPDDAIEKIRKISLPKFPALSLNPAKESSKSEKLYNSLPVDMDEPTVGIELAPTAPKVVHNRVKIQNTASILTTFPEKRAQRSGVQNELEQVRSELKEIKFYLGALASRYQAIESRENDHSYETPEADPKNLETPFYEAYLILTADGLPSQMAVAAAKAACNRGKIEGKSVSEICRIGLVDILPSLIGFSRDLFMEGAESATSICLLGPTGVGKSTLIAKMAAYLTLKKRKVEIVTLDTYRIAAQEQLKTYAEVIGAGFHAARNTDELERLRESLDSDSILLIDTPGSSPADLSDHIELAEYLRAKQDIHKVLIMCATKHPADARVAAAKYKLFGVNSLILTKLDETSRPGAAVRVAAEIGLPLAYITDGQRVPEDLEKATPESLAERLIRARPIAAIA
jgi:flagellar biosynthesis protein FlhF